MPKLKIFDLGFCEVIAQKEIDVKGGLTIGEFASTGSAPLFSRFTFGLNDLSDFNDLSDLPLEVESFASEDGSTIETLENRSAGISGFQITSPDGRSSIRGLIGDNFGFATASSSQFIGA
jgi:hypothetical protein